MLHTVHRLARRMGVDVLGGVHGNRLVLVLGGAEDPLAATEKLLAGFGDGPVVVGPAVPTLDEATESARAALAGFRAAPAWPTAPRPVAAADLLPERALAGDAEARRMLRQDVYGVAGARRRRAAGDPGRVLRRRRRAGERRPGALRPSRTRCVTGCVVWARSPACRRLLPRDAFALRIALTVGRLDPTAPPAPPHHS